MRSESQTSNSPAEGCPRVYFEGQLKDVPMRSSVCWHLPSGFVPLSLHHLKQKPLLPMNLCRLGELTASRHSSVWSNAHSVQWRTWKRLPSGEKVVEYRRPPIGLPRFDHSVSVRAPLC